MEETLKAQVQIFFGMKPVLIHMMCLSTPHTANPTERFLLPLRQVHCCVTALWGAQIPAFLEVETARICMHVRWSDGDRAIKQRISKNEVSGRFMLRSLTRYVPSGRIFVPHINVHSAEKASAEREHPFCDFCGISLKPVLVTVTTGKQCLAPQGQPSLHLPSCLSHLPSLVLWPQTALARDSAPRTGQSLGPFTPKQPGAGAAQLPPFRPMVDVMARLSIVVVSHIISLVAE